MPHYMTQFAYTAETWAALRSKPVDRTATVSALADKLGCRLLSFYYHFGEYDGFVIVDAPDDTTANAFVIAAIAPGHLRVTRTTRLMTPAEAVEAMRKSQGAELEVPRR